MSWAATGRRKPFLRRLALWNLAALLLLSGCISDKIGPPSDDGGPNTADIPQEAADQGLHQLDRESLVSDDSGLDLADILRETMGQDLYLRQENLEQYAGFSEETGYGELEQPLEQIFEYRRTYLDGRCHEVFVPNNRSEEVLLLELPDGSRQELHIQPETYMVVSWDLRQEDLNFDGYLDLALDIGGARGGSHFADALLWDESTQTYREEPSFTQVSSPVLDPEHSVIWAGYEVNWESSRRAFEVREGVFTQTHKLKVEYMNPAYWSEGMYCIEYALTDDGWSEVNRLELSTDDFDLFSALEHYIEVGPVWPGWLWADMDWHTVHG